ncbi:MAG: ribosomal protein S18-alanine N-acetyltransferase [Chloroflexaceae bacterium]|nr:ribosomal protein S18-alanine N-acetyltransferase [Chloroflexaceae bacterium]
MYYFTEPMAEADIPRVQEIESQSFTTPWSANTYRRELQNTSACRYIVARASYTPPSATPRPRGLFATFFANLFSPQVVSNGVVAPIVGYGGVWLTVDEAHVTTIAVDPQHRGRSVGELLLVGLIDSAMQLRAPMLTLEVRVSNTAAQNLYLKYGFRPQGTRPRYYTDNGEDALVMWTDRIDTPEYQNRLTELRQRLFARLRAQAERVVN